MIKVKVLVVSVLGLIASEKVARRLVESETPVAPAVGVVAVIVGGVVSAAPASAVDPRECPVAVVEADPVAAVGDDEAQRLRARDADVDRLGRASPRS